MAYGKYSPLVRKGDFVGTHWKLGKLGYKVELADDGYDWYGYNENGRDAAGKTEDDYLQEYLQDHIRWLDETGQLD